MHTVYFTFRCLLKKIIKSLSIPAPLSLGVGEADLDLTVSWAACASCGSSCDIVSVTGWRYSSTALRIPSLSASNYFARTTVLCFAEEALEIQFIVSLISSPNAACLRTDSL